MEFASLALMAMDLLASFTSMCLSCLLSHMLLVAMVVLVVVAIVVVVVVVFFVGGGRRSTCSIIMHSTGMQLCLIHIPLISCILARHVCAEARRRGGYVLHPLRWPGKFDRIDICSVLSHVSFLFISHIVHRCGPAVQQVSVNVDGKKVTQLEGARIPAHS